MFVWRGFGCLFGVQFRNVWGVGWNLFLYTPLLHTCAMENGFNVSWWWVLRASVGLLRVVTHFFLMRDELLELIASIEV